MTSHSTTPCVEIAPARIPTTFRTAPAVFRSAFSSRCTIECLSSRKLNPASVARRLGRRYADGRPPQADLWARRGSVPVASGAGSRNRSASATNHCAASGQTSPAAILGREQVGAGLGLPTISNCPICACDRSARHSAALAPCGHSTLLALEIEGLGGPARSIGRNPRVDPRDEHRQSAVGSTKAPWRATQAGDRYRPNQRRQIHNADTKTPSQGWKPGCANISSRRSLG